MEPIRQRPRQVSTVDYQGCMRTILLNSVELNQTNAIKSDKVTNGCHRSDGCLAKSCGNNGNCVDLLTDYKCQCTSGYVSDTCSKGKKTIYFFNSLQHVEQELLRVLLI